MSATPLPPACIIAGGRGTRLGDLTDSVPKPLIPVAGRPFIEWPLLQLREAGFHRAAILAGYRGDMLVRQLGTGERLGMSLVYSHDGPQPLGTLGALRQALPLVGDPVPVLYADTYLQVDFSAVVAAHRSHGLPVTMTVLRNQGRWGASNAVVSGGRVVAYSKNPSPLGADWIDYGFLVVDREAILESTASDLADLTTELAAAGMVEAYTVSERFYEIGTPEALIETDAFLRSIGFEGPG